MVCDRKDISLFNVEDDLLESDASLFTKLRVLLIGPIEHIRTLPNVCRMSTLGPSSFLECGSMTLA